MITSGEGRYRVWLKVERLDDGMVCILGGGERSHVGGVVVKEPGKEAVALSLEGHYDEQVLRPIAEAVSRKYNMTVAALGGVHVDDATKEEIDILVANCRELAKCI
ncbi:MAG: hypothetical protein V1934_04750 [Methanobacteriota archaeon]